MLTEKILIIEFDGADDTQTVGQYTCFIGITKMTVQILLFDLIIR